MKPDKEHLLHELLDGGHGARREATLFAGAHILRRRRRWRAATRRFGVALVLLAAGFWVETARFETVRVTKPASPAPLQAKASVAPSPAGPQALTDDELLALFPNTPVGLATLADGKKRLIFPRPSDEEKYIIHL